LEELPDGGSYSILSLKPEKRQGKEKLGKVTVA
jgi:hypothetical protein